MITQRTYSEIRQSIRNGINDKDDNIDSKPGTFVSDVLVCPTSDELAATYMDLKTMEINQSVLTASSSDLDRLGYNYFTYRKNSTKSTGRIRFYIKNTNKTTLSLSSLPSEVYVPVGYIVGTTSTTDSDQIEFVTTESAYVTNKQILNSLSTDNSTGYKYVECEIEASIAGTSSNIDAGGINQMISSDISGVVSVNNQIATTGGTDAENDMSLKFRIMLSITGASMCTSAGYLKFTLQQDYVEDCLVIAGGDSIMFRDGGYLDSSKSYSYGRGGMVDIWVRGKRNQEVIKQYAITTTYLEKGSDDIVLEYQPVTNIVSIKSNSSGTVFENANNYSIEYGTTTSNSSTIYYQDILWDFSITNTFPDTDMYALDIVDLTEIEILKKKVDEELISALDYLNNIDYSINWSLVTYEDISKYTVKPVFQKVYYNGKPYKIIAVDARLNGRTFVKIKNKIYLRYYKQPDYTLLKTTYTDERYTSQIGNDIGNSILSQDAVHWINKDVLQEGDTLTITYNYNQLILDLQKQINSKRIVVADILMRQSYEVAIQILMNVICDKSTTSTAVKNTIATKLTTYVNSLKTLGGTIEESELAAIARQTSGVTYVDLDSISLSKTNSTSTSKILLNSNEYFLLDNVDITVTSEASISD